MSHRGPLSGLIAGALLALHGSSAHAVSYIIDIEANANTDLETATPDVDTRFESAPVDGFVETSAGDIPSLAAFASTTSETNRIRWPKIDIVTARRTRCVSPTPDDATLPERLLGDGAKPRSGH